MDIQPQGNVENNNITEMTGSPAPPGRAAAFARSQRTWGNAARSVGNRLVPLATNAATSVGRTARNRVLPLATSLGRTVRNQAVYPVGRALRSGIEACVGRACGRVRKQMVLSGVYTSFSPGLEIQDVDLDLARHISSSKNSRNMASEITMRATDLVNAITNIITDRNEDSINLQLFRTLATGDLSSQIKGLYLLHYASMGRIDEIDPITAATATNILMQAYHEGADKLEYTVTDENELQGILNEYERKASVEGMFNMTPPRRLATSAGPVMRILPGMTEANARAAMQVTAAPPSAQRLNPAAAPARAPAPAPAPVAAPAPAPAAAPATPPRRNPKRGKGGRRTRRKYRVKRKARANRNTRK